MRVDLILRAEAVAFLAAGALAYFELGGHPLWLLPLLLLPDVSMVGYLGGPKLGALTYNLAHNLVAGIGLLVVGWYAGATPVAILGAILIAHVGMDRALDYGLKLPTDFKDTHLGRIGRQPR